MKTSVRAAMLAALAAGGCGVQPPPQPLNPAQFIRSGPPAAPDGLSRTVDENGTLVYGELHAPLLPGDYTTPKSSGPVPISPVVREAIPRPGEVQGSQAVAVAATAPTTNPAPPPSGVYQIDGFVMELVSGVPIYADKVLASIDHQLAAEARRLDPEQFRVAAARAIADKTQQLERDQLEVAAANSFLSQEDKTQADLYAMVWRRQQISLAGGSVELAQQKSLESGQSLEEQVKQQHDLELVRLYFQRREFPKIHVTPADMRRYYQEHLDSEFTRVAAVNFRLIRIDVGRSGSAQRASEKAEEIINRLKHADDFDTLARKYNDDPSLMNSGGDVGWVNKGSYVNDAIEQAVWALKPGEFTQTPIEATWTDGRTCFCVALLQSRRAGAQQQFDDPDVQERIRNTLFSQQLRALAEKDDAELRRQAVVAVAPHALEVAVEMAMQRYPAWAAAR